MQLEDILRDPPHVHEGAPSGVWSADRSLYDYLVKQVSAGCRTAETGLGVSTAVFATLEAQHTCVVGDSTQVVRFMAYAADRQIPLDAVTLIAEPSDEALPNLRGTFDLVLIDGGHAFPTPTLDWYYFALRLKPGGVVVIDDANMPSISRFLLPFLDADPRWERSASGGRWVAYRKASDHPGVREEWTAQPFLGAARVELVTRVKVAANRRLPWLRSLLRRT